MNQAEDRISKLKDKAKDLDKISKAYDKKIKTEEINIQEMSQETKPLNCRNR